MNAYNTTEMVRNCSSAWQAHWIVFSVLFSIIGCYSVLMLIKVIHRAPELTKSYRLSVFSLVIILCSSRTLYLMFNPYEINVALVTNIPLVVLRLLYGLGQPSLTAAFGLIHASFLKIAKVRQYRQEPLLKTRTILIIIGFYFTFGMITEAITGSLPGWDPMLTVSACVALVGCLIVTVTVSYSGIRILRTATQNKKTLTKGSFALSVSTEQLVRAKSVAKVARVTLAAGTFCFGLTVANSVVFVKMIKQMSSVTQWHTAWQFITFVTSVRTLEIAMACTLIYALSHGTMDSSKTSILRRFTRKFRKSATEPCCHDNIGADDVENASWKTSSFSSQKEFVME